MSLVSAKDRRTLSWYAFLVALLPALTLIVVIEALRVSLSLSSTSFWRMLGTFAEVATSGTQQLSKLLVIAALQAACIRWADIGSRRPLWWILLFGLSATQIYFVRLVAIEAPYLAQSFWITTGFLVLGLIYSLLTLWLASPMWAGRVRRFVGVLLAAASVVAGMAHYSFYVGLYPTLHSSSSMVAFLGVHLGLTMALTGTSHSRRRNWALVGVSATLLLFGLLAPSSATARDRPYIVAQSALVRPVAVAQTPDSLLRPSAPPRRTNAGPIRPDTGALDRFAKHSGLPQLPPDFRLEDHDVLMVFIDAARYDRTSLADPALGTTPTLAKLVRDGALSYTRAYSTSNGTYPTMSSLLSMTTPSFARHELHGRHWHGSVQSEQTMASELFQLAGHRTFYVGSDFKRVMTIRVHGLWQGFDSHHLELVYPEQDLNADARIASKAISEIQAARSAGQRYFGIVFFISPHDDYQVHFPRRPSKTPRDRYDQELLYADVQLRRILDEVARGGERERTVVIVTSDHGEAFGEHRHRYHLSSLYAEQVHVPLVITVPGLEGGLRHTSTSNIYPLPWLLLRGPQAAKNKVEGILREDLGPLLRETEGAVISEFISRQRQHATLRYDDYTIYYDLLADFFGIFDVRGDPGELVDLRENRPDLVKRFTPLVLAYRRVRFAGQRYYFAPPERWAPDP